MRVCGVGAKNARTTTKEDPMRIIVGIAAALLVAGCASFAPESEPSVLVPKRQSIDKVVPSSGMTPTLPAEKAPVPDPTVKLWV